MTRTLLPRNVAAARGARVAALPVLVVSALSVFALAGCSSNSSSTQGSQGDDVAGSTAASEPADAAAGAASSLGAQLPVDALPEVEQGQEACPYLDTQWFADANGQRVTASAVDARFDPPACVWWSYPPEPQAQVIVRHMGEGNEGVKAAIEVVNAAAPIDSTEPADKPDGWDGGRGATTPEVAGGVYGDQGSVYAVQKGSTAVVVFSNQQQTVKPQMIAEKVIENLGL